MRDKKPSRTALGAAAHRAAHQFLENWRIFADPLAVTILGKQQAQLAALCSRMQPATRGLRFFIAARSRIAEDALAAGVEARGVRQLVVLGAGLDTFAYRNPLSETLLVFEVDHPETQAWNRRRLAETGIEAPRSLTYAPMNFERDDLLAALEVAGFDPSRRTFFMWLGVVPYLTGDAIRSTLRAIGGLKGGGEVVFDYSDPPASLLDEARTAHAKRAKRVAALGEPFLSYLEPDELHAQLRVFGFTLIDDLGPGALVERYIRPRNAVSEATLRNRGGHVIFAATATA